MPICALDGLTIEADSREFVAMVGPSGAFLKGRVEPSGFSSPASILVALLRAVRLG